MPATWNKGRGKGQFKGNYLWGRVEERAFLRGISSEYCGCILL